MNPLYEWDEAKRGRNIDQRNLDFASLRDFDWDQAEIIRTDRHDEIRYTAYGYMEGRLVAVAYTWRGDVRRIISFRKANSREVAKYG